MSRVPETSTSRSTDDLAVSTYGPEDAPVTVFLAHCWTLNKSDWHYQVRDLQQEFGHGIRIVTWDHRGHGESAPASRADCRIGGMTLMALCEHRPDLFERVVGVAFVATSSGALDTVTLGLPEAGELLRAQIPRMLALRSRTLSNRARRRAPVVETVVVRRFLFGRPMRLVDAALTVEGLISCSSDTMVGYYEDCMRHERTAVLKVLDGIPVHVLVGTGDRLTPPAHARRIAEHVEGAVLTVAPGAGHMLPLERDQLVSGALIKLVRPHAGAPA